MPKTKRFTRRTRSTPTQIQGSASAKNKRESHGPSHSEPAVHTSPSISIAVQPTKVKNKNLPKSKQYWTADLIDKDGVIRETRLRLRDLKKVPTGKKVIIEWNKEGQPVGEALGLFLSYVYDLASNAHKFPVNYDNWSAVPSTYKDHVWNDIIAVKFQVNDEEHKKWILSNMGEKWEENRSWLYHDYYDPSVDLEENIQWGPDSIPKDQWISLITEICGENNSGPSHSSRSSTSSDGITPTEFNDLKLELHASNARIQALEEQVAFLMNNFRGQIPPIFNQGADLGAPGEEVSSSSSASHEPQNHGPGTSI